MKDYTEEFTRKNPSEGLTTIKQANKIAQREYSSGWRDCLNAVEYQIQKLSKSHQYNTELKRGKLLTKKEIRQTLFLLK